MKNKKEKPITRTDKLIDHLYEHRKLIIIYFVFALIMSFIKYALVIYFSHITLSGGEILAWSLWAIMFYPLLKFFVFRYKSPNIYALMQQIIIYIICTAVLWFVNQVAIGFFAAITRSGAAALSIGGMVTEVLCLVLMWKVVFKSKN